MVVGKLLFWIEPLIFWFDTLAYRCTYWYSIMDAHEVVDTIDVLVDSPFARGSKRILTSFMPDNNELVR